MALYVGDYQYDLGRVQPCLLLKSYLIEMGGLITRTSYDFDAQYLPTVFLANVDKKTEVKISCGANFRPRRMLLYLSELSYLSVYLPFTPTSSNYLLFLSEVKANSAIKKVKYVGESINAVKTQIWTNE